MVRVAVTGRSTAADLSHTGGIHPHITLTVSFADHRGKRRDTLMRVTAIYKKESLQLKIYDCLCFPCVYST
jgi:hypothetical protein